MAVNPRSENTLGTASDRALPVDRDEPMVPVTRVDREAPPIQRSLSEPFSEERVASVPAVTSDQVLIDAPVVDAEGTAIGTVKEVRESDFLVDRPMKRDVYITYGDVRELAGDRLLLKITSDDVDRLDFPSPSLL